MDYLPNEVLIEIFDYLQKDSIWNVLNVCRNWKNVVINSTRLLKKLEASVRPSSIDNVMEEYSSIPMTSLMLNTLVAKEEPNNLNLFNEKLKNLIEKHKTTIEFTEMIFSRMEFLTDYISQLSKIKHLNLVNARARNEPQLEISLENLPKFPHLKLIGLKNATHTLKYLQHHQVETLKCIDVENLSTGRNISEFMKVTKSLKEVKFMGFIPHLIEIENFTCELTTLTILIKGQTETQSNSILDLMRAQKNSLKELRLIGFNTSGFVECAINELQLTKLEIDITRLKFPLTALKVNKNIKNLSLQVIAQQNSQLIKIIEVLPNVENFKIISNTNIGFNEWIMKVNDTMTRLKNLSIDALMTILPPKNLNLKSLESLTVSKLGNEFHIHGFIQLASRCPNLKKLIATGYGVKFMQTMSDEGEIVEDTTLCRVEFLTLLATLPKLEELELRGKLTLTDEIVEILISDFCKLKKFNFSAEKDWNLSQKLKKLNQSKIQCKILEIDNGKRGFKRKYSEER